MNTVLPCNTYHNISYFKYDGTVSYASSVHEYGDTM
jgi:hypothetical protein